MDLRPLIKSQKHIDRAKHLSFNGLLNYQPFIFTDNYAVGNGLGVGRGRKKTLPSIFCPEAMGTFEKGSYGDEQTIGEERREEFFSANDRLRRFYDGMIDQVREEVGPIDGMSVLDVGCNSGYFPVSFSRKGVKRAVGFDRVDYSETIKLLNDICGTKVDFRLWSYDGSVKAPEQFDIVTSVAVLVHLSDPLNHLAWLGSSAEKALLVFTPCHDDDDYSVRFHTINRYYEDQFPYCFDVTTVSKRLLRLSFEMMGFTRIIEINDPGQSMPEDWRNKHLVLLGIREQAVEMHPDRTVIHRQKPEE